MNDSMKGILGAHNLSVVYNQGTSAESVALRGVTFHALAKEFIVVFGPSGCGKSTLLYTLTGIERHIAGGEAWLGVSNVAAMGPVELLNLHRREVGMIFQSYNLISTLNVLQNVSLPLLAIGVPADERKRRAEVLLDRFRITHLAGRYPSQLSGGQQQRVAIARALITNPTIIVADEPTGNLDSQSAEIVLRQLLELNRNDHKTILLVTHDPAYLSYADRILYMKDGLITHIEEKDGKKEGIHPENIESANKESDTYGTSPFDIERNGELSFEELSRTAVVSSFLNAHAMDIGPVLWSRLRHMLDEVVLEKLSRKDALLVLEKDVLEGGLGYKEDNARQLLIELEDLLELRRWLSSFPPRERLAANFRIHILRFLMGIRFGTISMVQTDRLEKILVEYMTERVSTQRFIEEIEKSVEQGGVGLAGSEPQYFASKLLLIKDLIPAPEAAPVL